MYCICGPGLAIHFRGAVVAAELLRDAERVIVRSGRGVLALGALGLPLAGPAVAQPAPSSSAASPGAPQAGADRPERRPDPLDAPKCRDRIIDIRGLRLSAPTRRRRLPSPGRRPKRASHFREKDVHTARATGFEWRERDDVRIGGLELG